MSRKRFTPEDIINKLRHANVLFGQAKGTPPQRTRCSSASPQSPDPFRRPPLPEAPVSGLGTSNVPLRTNQYQEYPPPSDHTRTIG